MTPKQKMMLKSIITGEIYFHHIFYNNGNGITEVEELIRKINLILDKSQ